MGQINIDFSTPVLKGKRDKVVSITCSTELKDLIDLVVKLQHTDISKIGLRYFVEGISRDIGNMFMAEPHLDSTLKNILSRIEK